MRDEWFIRGEVPMTKNEVRAVSVEKLELSPDSVLYDIGAGTGSVSVEAAAFMSEGTVYAVEKKREAVELLEKNRKKFQAEQIRIIEGAAPEALEGLEAPTHAFLGGTSGRMADILSLLLAKNPEVRVVVNAITLESVSKVMEWTAARGIEADIVLVSVSRAKAAGRVHMMMAQNPVYVISFGGRERGRESGKASGDSRKGLRLRNRISAFDACRTEERQRKNDDDLRTAGCMEKAEDRMPGV